MHLEKTLDFRVPRDLLWDYLRDREKFKAIGYVESVEVDTGVWPQEGARGRIHVRLREKTYVAPFVVERYRDGQELIAKVTSGPLNGASFYFHARDAASGPSATTLTGGFKMGGLLGMAARASGLQDRLGSAVDRELLAFRDRVEKEHGSD